MLERPSLYMGGVVRVMLMMTSSNGNIFRVTGHLCGKFTGPGEFPAQRPVTRSFDVFFDLRLNKRLSKQPWGWWFETPEWSLWRHRNVTPKDNISRYQFVFIVFVMQALSSYPSVILGSLKHIMTWRFLVIWIATRLKVPPLRTFVKYMA